jgi:hypothetical protein
LQHYFGCIFEHECQQLDKYQGFSLTKAPRWFHCS